MEDEARLAKSRRSLKEERAVAYRRRYIGSLSCAIFLPLAALSLFVGPFIFTSWSQDVRITWWVVAFFCLLGSVHYILSHDKEFGYHP
ncbi:hypothetical protein ACP70R_023784 [Stipagrostis hirtigluma subsp. patula]